MGGLPGSKGSEEDVAGGKMSPGKRGGKSHTAVSNAAASKSSKPSVAIASEATPDVKRAIEVSGSGIHPCPE